MQYTKVCSVILGLVLLAFVACADEVESPKTLGFEKAGEEKLFVEFYAPWCGHCKKLAPVWEQLTTTLSEPGTNVKAVQVNCDENKPLCKQYGITGYPTLKLYQNGNEAKYNGPRTLDDLKKFALETTPGTPVALVDPNAEPAKKPVDFKPFSAMKPTADVVTLTDENFDQMTSTGAWLVQFHIGSGFDKEVFPELSKTAKDVKEMDVKVATINVYENKRLTEKFKLNAFPTIALLQNGAVKVYESSERQADKLVQFVKDNKVLNTEAQFREIMTTLRALQKTVTDLEQLVKTLTHNSTAAHVH